MKGVLQALEVVDVGGDDFDAEFGEFFGLVGIDIACQRPRGKFAGRVGKDRPNESAALCAGGADDGDDFLVCHRNLL